MGKVIYQGSLKGICAPGFNCYACPLAIGSCPIGTLQHFAVIREFPLYLLGYLVMVGGLVGRMVCGWFCPFGFLQDLLYKLPSPKLHLPHGIRYLKYGILAIPVLCIPYITYELWFCKICPQGGLQAGLPLVLIYSELRALIGGLFGLKLLILFIFLVLFVLTQRPFCRGVCPLGAIYSLFNRLSLFKLHFAPERCDDCGVCSRVCPMELSLPKELDSIDCIRCRECERICLKGAISFKFRSRDA
jgi:polyferredoxin